MALDAQPEQTDDYNLILDNNSLKFRTSCIAFTEYRLGFLRRSQGCQCQIIVGEFDERDLAASSLGLAPLFVGEVEK